MAKLIRNGKVLKFTDGSINRTIFDYGVESTVIGLNTTIQKGINVVYNGLLSNLLDKDGIPYTENGLSVFLGESESSSGGGSDNSLQIEVNELLDLPTPNANNEITLSERKSYLFGDVDLLGNTIVVTSPNVTISGFSSETSQLTSTGKAASIPLIRLENTCVVRDLSFYNVDYACQINNGNFDWEGVNFINCIKGIEINEADNVILDECSFIASGGVTLDGTISALVIKTTIFAGNTTQNEKIINITSNAVINGRISLDQCPILCGEVTQTAIYVDAAASFPSIASASNYPFDLEKVRFSSLGNTLVGRQAGDGFTIIVNSPPLLDSKNNVEITLQGNNTSTNIPTQGTYYPIEGTFNEGITTQNFISVGNLITFNGRSEKNITIDLFATITASNNNQVGLAIRYTPLGGNPIDLNPLISTSNSSGRAENISTKALINLQNGDTIQPVITNNNSSSVLVEDCILVIT